MSFKVKYLVNSWSANESKMATSGLVGSDLFAAEGKKRKPRSATAVSTDLQVEIPTGYYGHILPRSGLARHYFVGVGGGVIHSDFWEEVDVIMFNHSNRPYEVRAGNRITQVVFHRREIPNFVKCEELSKTESGMGGFESTGISLIFFFKIQQICHVKVKDKYK